MGSPMREVRRSVSGRCPPLGVALLLWSLLLLVGCSALETPDGAASLGQETGGRGLGGTGMLASDLGGRGLGGTGSTATREGGGGLGGTGIDPGEGERGLGGTGHDPDEGERGLGGTGRMAQGVIGTLTAFGSVWVNDLHIHYDAQTDFSADGLASDASALALGQWLLIETEAGEDGALHARSIEMRHILIGPVQTLEADGSVRLLDQRLRLAAEVAVPDPGQWLAVSGLRTPSGEVLVDQLSPVEAGAALVRGRPEQDATGEWRLGALVLELGQGVVLQADTEQRLRGQWREGRLWVEEAQADRPNGRLQTQENWSVEVRVWHDSEGGPHPLLPIDLDVRLPRSFDRERVILELRRDTLARPERGERPAIAPPPRPLRPERPELLERFYPPVLLPRPLPPPLRPPIRP